MDMYQTNLKYPEKIGYDTKEKARQVEEHRKTFVYATKAFKALQDEVVGLRQALHDSLQQSMRDVLGVERESGGAGKEVLPRCCDFYRGA